MLNKCKLLLFLLLRRHLPALARWTRGLGEEESYDKTAYAKAWRPGESLVHLAKLRHSIRLAQTRFQE